MNRIVFVLACLVVGGAVVYFVCNPPRNIQPQNAAAEQDQDSKPLKAKQAAELKSKSPAQSNKTEQTHRVEESNSMPKEYNKLTAEEERVILGKGTEYPGTGEYNSTTAEGVYVCRQ